MPAKKTKSPPPPHEIYCNDCGGLVGDEFLEHIPSECIREICSQMTLREKILEKRLKELEEMIEDLKYDNRRLRRDLNDLNE